MKFFTVFAAIVAVALASPPQWTLNELSTAINDPNTHEALKPLLQQALDDLLLAMVSGSPQTSISVSTGVQTFTPWTLHELSEAIQDPATDPTLLIYLEQALNDMLLDIFAGGRPEYVIVATPVGTLPGEPVVIPGPVEEVVIQPTPEPTPSPAFSPLVQIIVNVNAQEEVAPAPVVVPEPNPVDVIVINPIVNPINPEPVVLPPPVLPVVVEPIDIIAVNPVVDVNPIDILHPMPVVKPVNVVDVVAPLV